MTHVFESCAPLAQSHDKDYRPPTCGYADPRPAPPVVRSVGQPTAGLVRFAPRDIVFCHGDRVDRMYEILAGTVILSQALDDGRRQIVEILGAGKLLGLPAGGFHTSTAEALSDVQARVVDLKSLHRSAGLRRRVDEQMREQIAAMYRLAVLLGRKTAGERVASFLASLVHDPSCATAHGRGTPLLAFDFALADLADHLGLSVETVCRELSGLKRAGIIAQPRPGQLAILDAERLADHAQRALPPKSYPASQARIRMPRRSKDTLS